MSEPRRRRRLNRETVGTLKLTYKPGKTGPALPQGELVRVDEVTYLRTQMPKYRVPGQQGRGGQQQAATVTISFYRTRSGGAPGLTVTRSVELRPADLDGAEAIDTFEVDVPNLS